jgi:hypothetical protein
MGFPTSHSPIGFLCPVVGIALIYLRNIRNIKMDLLEIGVNVVDWIGLAQDRYRWRALVNTVMNLRVP